jgi:hypothetical protein
MELLVIGYTFCVLIDRDFCGIAARTNIYTTDIHTYSMNVIIRVAVVVGFAIFVVGIVGSVFLTQISEGGFFGDLVVTGMLLMVFFVVGGIIHSIVQSINNS